MNTVGPVTVVAPDNTKLVPVALLNTKLPVLKFVKLFIAVVVATPLTDEVMLTPSNCSEFEFTRSKVVELALPFTLVVTVTVLEVVAAFISLDVLEATASAILRLDTTPLTFDIIALPDEVSKFPVTILLVAVTPLIVVVSILPAAL